MGNFTSGDKKEVNQSDLSAFQAAILSLTVTSLPALQRVGDYEHEILSTVRIHSMIAIVMMITVTQFQICQFTLSSFF